MSEVQALYVPAEDEPSVFSSDVHARGCGSGSYNHERWWWPVWFKAKKRRAYYEQWRAGNPNKPSWNCTPFFDTDDDASAGLSLIVRLRKEVESPGYPAFYPTPAMFIGDTRKISLRWVLEYARANEITPDEAVVVAELERDRDGLTLDKQDLWQERWWKEIMELPMIGYPIWRYTEGPDAKAVLYQLLPGPISESIVITQVHEKNPNITYKLVTIKQKGGEVVGEFTGFEGFDREQLNKLLCSFWAGF
jgi:hypothetical protein